MQKTRPNVELYEPLINRDQEKQCDNASIQLQDLKPKLAYPQQKPRDRLVDRVIASDVDNSITVSSYPQIPYPAPEKVEEEKSPIQNIYQHHGPQHIQQQQQSQQQEQGNLYPSIQRMQTAPTYHHSPMLHQQMMWQQKQLPLQTQYIQPQKQQVQQQQQQRHQQQPMQRAQTQSQIPTAQKCTKRIECGTCKGLMEYDSRAFLVSCPYCTSVNYTTPISILKCGACRIDFYFPLNCKEIYDAQPQCVEKVIACPCGAINQVPNVPLKPIS